MTREKESNMRDLTKSMTSYTWAMSVFGMQQMLNLLGLGGNGSWNRSTTSLNNVTQAASDELGDTVRAVFRSGDTLQRGMVDVFLAPLSFTNWCGGGTTGGEGQRGGSWEAGRRDEWGDYSRGGGRTDGGRANADGSQSRSECDRGWSDRARRGTDGSGRLIDSVARAAAGGVDAMAAADTTPRATHRTADTIDPQQRGAPPASDPSLGWGPMPR
jgi:hypothetical protein